MKKLARNIIVAVLGYQVRQLIKKNQLKVIGVAGSVGKTSTKLAIAQTLSATFKVRYQDGNYNDLVTVPLIFFGEQEPSLFNPFTWLAVFWRNQRQLHQPYPYEIVVVEVGSDQPGDIAEFKKYLKLQIAVLTGITAEHMQFFKTLDGVAQEELAVSTFSTLIIANKDLCEDKYLKSLTNLATYGLKDGDFNLSNLGSEAATLSEPEQYSRIAALAVATKLGMTGDKINSGLANIQVPAGRMQKLNGVNGSLIIDDSYNASPVAVKLALDYLYKIEAPQKIALLGNMNEMGDYSKQAHEEVGSYCDPKQLALVVTLGPDAHKYLAPVAEAKGCKVQKFDDPYNAGEYLRPLLQKGTALLVKGSQNKVFAEETIKSLLADPNDANKLVRQSDYWLKIKQEAFKK